MTAREELECQKNVLVQEVLKGHYDNYSEIEKNFFQRRSTELFLEDVKQQVIEAMAEGRRVVIVHSSEDIEKISIEIQK